MRLIAAILLTVSLLGGLSACGKKGPPTLPPGQSDDFPRQYPTE